MKMSTVGLCAAAGLAIIAACQNPPPPPEEEGPGAECDVPERIGPPVTIALRRDSAAQGPARATLSVDKPVVVTCVGQMLQWRADPSTVPNWTVRWDGESPLEPAGPIVSGGPGGGEARRVGAFKYTVSAMVDGDTVFLDPDAVILPGR